MAIKTINFKETDLLEKGTINFSNNIVTIIGMNGSGKTIMMNNIKNNFEKDWIEQIILKGDFEKIEKSLGEVFNVGKNKINFENLSKEIKKDQLMKLDSVKEKLDDFIWDNFFNMAKVVLESQMNKDDAKKWINNLKKRSKESYFSKNILIEEFSEIEKYMKIDKHDEFSKKTKEIFEKQFGYPKVITVNMNKNPILNGHITPNGIGIYSTAQALRNNSNFFVRLLKISGLESSLDKIVKGEVTIGEDHINMINDWFTSYVSQDVKINLEINSNNFSISFNENKRTVPFDNLSKGTRNLVKILCQIEDVNSETIIQIDEPETGMHPMMQIQFRAFLEDFSKKTKARFIIYTHSINIVKDGPLTKGLYIVVRNKGKSKLYTKAEYAKIKDILDIQIYESTGYESIEHNYNYNNEKTIVILEGETDVIYMKKMSKLLNINNFEFTRTKLGGATSMDKTAIILEAVHGFDNKRIIASPDLDIKIKHPKVIKNLKEQQIRIVYVGTKEWADVEGLFSEKDKRYRAEKSSKGKNKKMNKANLFWREVKSKDILDNETIKNFKKYFDELNKKEE